MEKAYRNQGPLKVNFSISLLISLFMIGLIIIANAVFVSPFAINLAIDDDGNSNAAFHQENNYIKFLKDIIADDFIALNKRNFVIFFITHDDFKIDIFRKINLISLRSPPRE
jgi:hypothetical protein